MDKTLADEFVSLGGTLEERMPWRGSLAGEGLVGAAGRKRMPSTGSSESWFGLKAHLRGMTLRADLELHIQPDGYIGLCRLDGDTVNACGLFRKLPDRQSPATGKFEFLSGLAEGGLRRRIEAATVDETSCCAVAGLCYKPPRRLNAQECYIGDSLTLIPPFTGNGMSMAFEAAELSLDPLTQYSQGRIAWSQAVQEVRAKCRRRFAWRLAWAQALHRLLFFSWSRRALRSMLRHSDFAWRMLFCQTR
jgi:2-polyprenyl-6-methoxyphenol hydroxylase-like FAD-dependent oxidoreductase